MVSPPISRAGRAPGVWAIKPEMLLRLVGVSSSASRVNWVAADVDVTSTTGELPDTVIDSSSDPSFSATSNLAEKRSEEHTSEPSHTVISYAVFCLKKKRLL